MGVGAGGQRGTEGRGTRDEGGVQRVRFHGHRNAPQLACWISLREQTNETRSP